MNVSVENVDVGDRVVVWPAAQETPLVLVVSGIDEGQTVRTLHCSAASSGAFTVHVERDRTVDLVC